jgi:hypothetical protein
MLVDDWLSRQKPSISPPVPDRPLETRSAKKKRKIKVRRVPYAPSETTPARVRRKASQLPLPQGRRRANVQRDLQAKTTSAPTKKKKRNDDHEPLPSSDEDNWSDALDDYRQ